MIGQLSWPGNLGDFLISTSPIVGYATPSTVYTDARSGSSSLLVKHLMMRLPLKPTTLYFLWCWNTRFYSEKLRHGVCKGYIPISSHVLSILSVVFFGGGIVLLFFLISWDYNITISFPLPLLPSKLFHIPTPCSLLIVSHFNSCYICVCVCTCAFLITYLSTYPVCMMLLVCTRSWVRPFG